MTAHSQDPYVLALSWSYIVLHGLIPRGVDQAAIPLSEQACPSEIVGHDFSHCHNKT